MAHVSEYEVETKFIDKLESIGYEYVEIKNYPQLLGNLQTQLAKFNAQKLIDAKGKAELSDLNLAVFLYGSTTKVSMNPRSCSGINIF